MHMKVDRGSEKVALWARDILSDRKGEDIVVLDLREHSAIADYFVICSGTSTRHVDGMADELMQQLRKQGVKVAHVEGQGDSTWILLDYIDVVVHVFYHETRTFYSLDKLWGDAPRIA